MNIIFLTKGYEPVPSASGSLIKNVVTAAVRDHDVTVITQGAQEGAEESQRAGSSVVRVGVRTVGPWKVRLRRLLGGVSGLRSVGPLVEALDRAIVTDHDIVIPTTPDEFAAAIRLRQRRRFVLLPFILEVLPRPPAMAQHLSLVTRPGQRRRLRFEARLLRLSNGVLALPAVYGSLAREHPGVGNLTLTEHPMIRRVGRSRRPDGAPHEAVAVYAGGLDRRVRNPAHMLDVLHRAASCTPLTTHFFSYGNCEDMLADAALRGAVRARGAVSPTSAMEAMAGADLLLTQGNRDSLLTPSKIFDCMSTGLPVVHFYSSPDDPYLAYLKRYGLALTLDMAGDPDLNAGALVEFLTNPATKHARQSYEDVVKAFPECTPEHFLANVLELAAGPRALPDRDT